MLCAIVTCKGRLNHLKKTLPILKNQFDKIIVVDWNCPDKTWKWVESNHPEVTAVLKVNESHFHKTAALNLGASEALRINASKLCFIDADTIIISRIRPWLASLEPKQFAITGPKKFAHSQLIGFLCCWASDFESVGGFDEKYIGWGYEDLDMRMRLICDAACHPIWIPEDCFATIKHENALRSQYQTDSLQEGAKRNHARFKMALGERLAEHWSKELSEALPYK